MALQMNWQPSLNQKRKNKAPLGLKNLGNSCYLNSVLQCLTYTPPLANFCLNNQHTSLCDSASPPDRKRDCAFCILEKRIARSLSIDVPQDAPLKFVSCLRLYAEHFHRGRQEDAHEFLRYVIDACHNTCIRIKKLQLQRRKADAAAEEEGCNAGTIVKDIFGGALLSQIRCLSCGAESSKIDEIMDVSLEVLHSDSLKEAMQTFFQPEILDGSNKYKCEKCMKLVRARKQMSIMQAPNVLVIQLKRFEGIFRGKIDKLIAFEESMVLSSFMCKASHDPCPEYRLFGTIVHSGLSPESGHYYAYIKDAMGKWYCCDDTSVTISNVQEVLSEKVYILFFTRTNQRPFSFRTSIASHEMKPHVSNGNGAVISHYSDRSQINGVISHESSCSGASQSSKPIHHAKPVKTKVFDESSMTTVDKGSTSLQTKFSNLTNSIAKRVSMSSDVKVHDHQVQSPDKNGTVEESMSEKKSKKNVPSSTEGYGPTKNGTPDCFCENISCLSCRNGYAEETAKVDMHYSCQNGKPSTGMKADNGQPQLDNGVADAADLKRKSVDSDTGILLAKDAHLQSELESLKESLKKEASSVLQNCGWSEEVYQFMKSRKELRVDDDALLSKDEAKRLLIADSKARFIPQIPESLKAVLIQQLRVFMQDKDAPGDS